MKTKDRLFNGLMILLVIIFVWVWITTAIQAFKCTAMTQTELFVRIPKTVMLDWGVCTNY